nr:MFS transporter [Desulfuromonadales bacterium]NIR33249.1 MFS transporter [Desulfuromonadales bacterium]NIS41849.1 MFS transporter [Desulfuromonadales bacterium]
GRGLVNGLYVASYYAGGMVGSYLPGFAYQHFGWAGLVVVLEALVVCGFLLIATLSWNRQPFGNN